MPNDEFLFICPYYHKTIGNNLFCRGFSADNFLSVNESFVKQCFENHQKRNECIKRYCASFRYPDCRIAAINEVICKENMK